ncbi:B-cell lymphoma/leukemia 10 isoform X1 [Denticeps clupeoides]|nr:B-cell lymphoma/leukemia 10 isoform X1 [Denticeps clupeoides]
MDVAPLTEDEMAEIKKEALERLRPYLVDKIIASRHFDYLRSKKILTRDDTEEISCRSTDRKRAGKLLDYLAENPRGLDTLIESIRRERTINFLITRITDEVQRVKDERVDALKAEASSSGFPHSKCPSGATNNLSRTFSCDSNYDKCCGSTMLYHPEGERSPSESVRSAALSLGLLDSSSSSLPRPGDPGAPPLPEELQDEEPGADVGASGNTSSGGDANFQPLRSRSLTPPDFGP